MIEFFPRIFIFELRGVVSVGLNFRLTQASLPWPPVVIASSQTHFNPTAPSAVGGRLDDLQVKPLYLPCRPRVHSDEVPLHIVQRGHNRQPCFFGEEDSTH